MRYRIILLLVALAVAMPQALAQKSKKQKSIYHKGWIDFNKNGVKDTYEDPTADIDARVADLLRQMTLEEKSCQLATLYGYGRVLKDSLPTPAWKDAVWKDGIANIDEMLNGVPNSNRCMALVYPFTAHVGALHQVQRFFVEETRLGIPAEFSNEGIHGLNHAKATPLPAPISLGSTWNRDLIHRAGCVVGHEAKLLGYHSVYAPILDLARDPRWGRTLECYSEEPYLISELGLQMTRGIQEQGVAACLKHYAAYSVPKGGRDGDARTDPHITPRELHEIFMYPFRKVIQGAKPMEVMSSYNDWNGEPVSGSHYFLTQLLRQQYGFDGYVVSDSEAVEYLFSKHKVAATYEEAAKQVLEAGLNVRTNFTPPHTFINPVRNAYAQGLLSMETIDQRVAEVLKVKFRLGLFDDPYTGNAQQAEREAGYEKNVAFVDEVQAQGIVLLKNAPWTPANLSPEGGAGGGQDETIEEAGVAIQTATRGAGVVVSPSQSPLQGEDGMNNLSPEGGVGVGQPQVPVLPLQKEKLNKILVAGPLAEETNFMLSRYGPSHLDCVTLLQGIRDYVGADKVLYEKGCDVFDVGWPETEIIHAPLTAKEEQGIQRAVDAAKDVDIIIACLGEEDRTTGEGRSRTSLELPGRQQLLLERLYATGKPIVLVLVNGQPLTINWANKYVPAILETWFPSYRGGAIVAQMLFGDINPSGKLPITFPKTIGEVEFNFPFKRGSHNGPAWYKRPARVNGALYPFGYGLSYTTFEYSNMQVSVQGDDITVTADIRNTGSRDGEEVVQLYFSDVITSLVSYESQLRGFERVALKAGETKPVTFRLQRSDLQLLNRDMQWVVEPGDFEFRLGASSEDIRLRKTIALDAPQTKRISIFSDHIETIARQRNISLREAALQVRELGYSGADVYVTISDSKLRDLDAAGLAHAACIAVIDFTKGDMEKEVEQAMTFMAQKHYSRVLLVPGLLPKENAGSVLPLVYERVRRFTERAAQIGVTTTVEDYDNPQSPCYNTAAMDRIIAASPQTGVTFDTGNFLYCQEDVMATQQHFGSKIKHVHLKDRKSLTDMGTTPIGQGAVPTRQFIRRMLETGYDGWFTAEFFGAPDMYEWAKESAKFISEAYE